MKKTMFPVWDFVLGIIDRKAKLNILSYLYLYNKLIYKQTCIMEKTYLNYKLEKCIILYKKIFFYKLIENNKKFIFTKTYGVLYIKSNGVHFFQNISPFLEKISSRVIMLIGILV